MTRIVIVLLALGWFAPALAAENEDRNTVTTSVGRELVLPLGSLPERICWYQDQKYSAGARIQQGDSWLECGPQNEFESNGPLAWRTPKAGQPATRTDPRRKTLILGQ